MGGSAILVLFILLKSRNQSYCSAWESWLNMPLQCKVTVVLTHITEEAVVMRYSLYHKLFRLIAS